MRRATINVRLVQAARADARGEEGSGLGVENEMATPSELSTSAAAGEESSGKGGACEEGRELEADSVESYELLVDVVETEETEDTEETEATE